MKWDDELEEVLGELAALLAIGLLAVAGAYAVWSGELAAAFRCWWRCLGGCP